MRFSLATAALATMAVGVAANEEPTQTVIVTETARVCHKASTLPASLETTYTQVCRIYIYTTVDNATNNRNPARPGVRHQRSLQHHSSSDHLDRHPLQQVVRSLFRI